MMPRVAAYDSWKEMLVAQEGKTRRESKPERKRIYRISLFLPNIIDTDVNTDMMYARSIGASAPTKITKIPVNNTLSRS